MKNMKHRTLRDSGEMERLKAVYAGIFPNHIQEFASMVKKRINKSRTNFSK